MSNNNEIILAVYNGKKSLLSWTIWGDCYRIIFTSKKIVVGEAKLKLLQRIFWSYEYHCFDPGKKPMTLENKPIKDYFKDGKIIEEITYDEIKKIKLSQSADISKVSIYSHSDKLIATYNIPLRGASKFYAPKFFSDLNDYFVELRSQKEELMGLSEEELLNLLKS